MDDSVTSAASSPAPGDKDSDLLEFAKKCYRSSRDHFSKWREKAKEDYAFVAGAHWSDDEKAMLKEQLRPCITFNRVGTIIDAVAGYEVNNRQEVRFIPRRVGQAPVDELLTGAAKWVRDECEAEDEESDAFLDLIVCGMGCTDTRMDYDDDPDGMVRIDRFDPLEAVPDPRSMKRNQDDARFAGRVRKMPRSEAEAMADDGVVITGDGAPWSSLDESADDPHDQTEAKFYKNDQGGNERGDIKDELVVFQLQWWERETVWRVLDPTTQQLTTLPADRYRQISAAAKKAGFPLRAVKGSQRTYKQAFFCGETVLTQGECPDPKRFTLRFITAKRDRNHNTWYGLVRGMKDPQRWSNKWLSQVMHIINSNAKGGIIAELGAFEDQRQAEETWSDPSGITWAANGAIRDEKIMPKPQAPFPAGIQQLMEFAVTSIRDVTGVNVETLGLADREQPGILEAHRKQAAMTILAPMFDSLRRYRKEQGRVLLTFIREYLSDGRLIRIEGQEMAQYIPLIRDPNTVEYDVIVDDAPTSPNQKEQVFGILSQMLPMLMKANIPMPPDLLDYTPLPSSLVAKWKQVMQQHQAQPQQDPKMIAVQAKIAADKQQMQIDQQHQQMSMQADAADDQRRAQLEQQKAQMQMQLDREKAQQQIAIQHDKMMADIREAQMRAQADIEIARAKADTQNRLAEQRAAQQPAAAE